MRSFIAKLALFHAFLVSSFVLSLLTVVCSSGHIDIGMKVKWRKRSAVWWLMYEALCWCVRGCIGDGIWWFRRRLIAWQNIPVPSVVPVAACVGPKCAGQNTWWRCTASAVCRVWQPAGFFFFFFAGRLFNPLNTKRKLLYLKTQFVPRSKHFSSRL